jgi:hypothetical protein
MITAPFQSQDMFSVNGEVSRMPAHPVIRVLLTVTGLLLVCSVLRVFIRCCLGLKGVATVFVFGNLLKIETQWTFWGKKIRQSTDVAPLSRLNAVRFENRQRYFYLTVGFGALAVGGFVGMQWFLDGLRAGYPYLTAAGALIVAAGVATDIFLYLFVPSKEGRSRLILASGPWTICLAGVNADAAEQLILKAQAAWRER